MMMFDISHIFSIEYYKGLYCMIGCMADGIAHYDIHWEWNRKIENDKVK